jgi:hypothetical protein
MRQGATRFERGNRYFEACRGLATDLGLAFGWRREIVQGVGHSNKEMAVRALELIAEFHASR